MRKIQQLFTVLILGILLSQNSMAKTNASIEKMIKSSFSGVTSVETKNLILNKAQYVKVQSLAKAAVKTKYTVIMSSKILLKQLVMAYSLYEKCEPKKQQYCMLLIGTGT